MAQGVDKLTMALILCLLLARDSYEECDCLRDGMVGARAVALGVGWSMLLARAGRCRRNSSVEPTNDSMRKGVGEGGRTGNDKALSISKTDALWVTW